MSSGRGKLGGTYNAGKASYVDESLFGNTSGNTATTKLPSIGRNNSAHEKKGKPQGSDVVTVSARELERMLKGSPVMTADDISAAKRAADAKREQAQAVSKARKDKMLKLEEEARRNAPLTETEQLTRQANGATRSRADKLLEEQKDEVKHMNQMMLYSKCVTIRDAQIEEKRQIMQENEDENRKQDLMMEIERIRALEQYEAREQQRMEERRRGAKVLEDQIHARERERIRQEELRDQERIHMLREIERLKEEELQAQIEKKIRGKALVEEVAAANHEQIMRKELMKVREKDEDQKITEYVRAQMIKEQEIAAEKERVAREKEMETARMRAQQEKAADKQAELDELRARRYQEAKEREWRQKERATAERQVSMQRELADAREAQKNSKLKQRADMAGVEHSEFMRVLAVNRIKEQEDLVQTVTSLNINNQYKDDLLSQIQVNEEKAKKSRQEYLEEGVRIRAEADKERHRLLEIKARKLQELQECGVPDKYQAELERMKIMKA